jgi:glycosyltransferase involved in cell wall biosynthesis
VELVTVIIPAYNAEAYLADAVRSVLAQTWSRLQLVIVNDGSADSTPSVAQSFAASDARVIVISQPNSGLSAARNAGLAIAAGDAVCFLDADDVYLPAKIQRQADFLSATTGCDLVYSDFLVGDSDLTPTSLRRVAPLGIPMLEELAYRNSFAPVSPMIRRSLIDAVGTFDTSLTSSEDWDFWIRSARAGRLCYLPGAVAIYRTHPAQMHRDRKRMKRNQMAVIDKEFLPESLEWRTAKAAHAYSEAKSAWHLGQYRRAVRHGALTIRYARSVTRVRRVMRWSAYG